jgi:hypothetical protein
MVFPPNSSISNKFLINHKQLKVVELEGEYMAPDLGGVRVQ